jgi:hypothetical protein
MKYVIISYISLGLILSLAIGVEYNCVGQEMFPTYYGSPFVFKQKSLGSSMEYYYSVSGLLLNILIWSSVLFIINMIIKRLIQKRSSWINNVYKIIIVGFITFTTLNIAMDYIMIGNGFKKGFNYWYWDMNQEAKDWGMTCKGKNYYFQKIKICYYINLSIFLYPKI